MASSTSSAWPASTRAPGSASKANAAKFSRIELAKGILTSPERNVLNRAAGNCSIQYCRFGDTLETIGESTATATGVLARLEATAEAMGMTRDQVVTLTLALSVAMGVTTLVPSLWLRIPVVTAWSTPGAALLVTSVAAWQVLRESGAWPPAAYVAGHSLGEYSALVGAGAIAFADAIRLVAERGRLMQEAVPEGTGAMAAILGLEDQAVIDVCTQSAGDQVVQAVNFNSPGQIMIADETAAVAPACARARSMPTARTAPLRPSRGTALTRKRCCSIPMAGPCPFHAATVEPKPPAPATTRPRP